ncbi:MAG: molecular chaperone HtpG [Chlamydiota bacterium]
MSEGTLKIQSENILPIIKKWLYTDKEIFLRELVSNACDAIHKAKVLADQGEMNDNEANHAIEVTIDAKAKTLTISDTGIGMTHEEVEKYIAQLAFSGAEEFVKKYQAAENSDQIIGHFGLGFYSAFMPSDKVEIDTLSFADNATPAFWSCDGSSSYTLEKGTRKQRGTTIVLHISKENEEFLTEQRIRSILLKHCQFLPLPILLNGNQINNQEALWTHRASDCTDDQYLSFYRALYPFEPDPIFWIHLNVDYPFHLKGILYFPKMNRSLEASQGKSVQLYCNRVFVSDNCKDLLPDYLTILRGIIDSPDIPLNVSRNNLQMNRTIRQLSNHISKKIADKLIALKNTHFDQFTTCWPDIEFIIKLGILQDAKFYEKVRPCLLWKSSTETWTTLEDYLARNQDKTGSKIFYHHDANHTSHFVDMYKEQGIEILLTSSHLDIPLITFLEEKQPELTFQRLDGALDDTVLDKQREKTVLDAGGKTEAGKMADCIRSLLFDETLEVKAKSLTSDQVSAFLVLDEKSRRLRDYMALSGKESPSSLQSKRTFVINTNSPLIYSIYKLKDKNASLAKELTTHLYHLALLEQKELNPDLFSAFLKQSSRVLEQLSHYASKAETST